MPPVISPTPPTLRLVPGLAGTHREELNEQAARRAARERSMANHPARRAARERSIANHPAGRGLAGGGRAPASTATAAPLVAVGAPRGA
jgi:hypothetical protein